MLIGVNAGLGDKTVPALQELKPDLFRSCVAWDEVEAAHLAPGTLDWRLADWEADRCRKAGVKWFVCLYGPGYKLGWQYKRIAGNSGSLRNVREFREYVQQFVLRYRDVVGGYEIWPDAVWPPAMWESPLEGIARLGISPFTTSRVKLEAISPDEEDSAEDSIIQSFLPQRSLKYYIRYPKGYLWRVTPIVLIGLLTALAATIFRMSIFANPKIRISVLGLLFFVLLYTVIMTIPLLRYLYCAK